MDQTDISKLARARAHRQFMSPLAGRRIRSVDETHAELRHPRIAWASARQATTRVKTTEELQAAIDAARAGDVIALMGSEFGAVKIHHPWHRHGSGALLDGRPTTWGPPEHREEAVVSIVNGNAPGERPAVLSGIAIESMAHGSELQVIGLRLRPKEEWNQEKERWESGASIIGSWSWPGFGVVRLKSCRFTRPVHSDAYGGNGLKWAIRTYCLAITCEDCEQEESEDGRPVIFQEHIGYTDNCAFVQLKGNLFRSTGRTHWQTGSRLDFMLPERWLGIAYHGNHFEDGFTGSATAGSTTIYGYPGDVLIADHRIDNPGHKLADGKTLDPAAGLVVFETYNYGGNALDPNGFAVSHLIVDGLKITMGPGKLDAVTLEGIDRADLSGIDLSGCAPGTGFVNVPGLYGHRGVRDLHIHGTFQGTMRSRQGNPGTKVWHTYTADEIADLTD